MTKAKRRVYDMSLCDLTNLGNNKLNFTLYCMITRGFNLKLTGDDAVSGDQEEYRLSFDDTATERRCLV